IFISYVFSKNEIEAEKKLMKYNDRLKEEANTDPLTGLYNRRKAVEFMKEITDGIRENVSVAIGDIDFFKKVNDTHGHDVGDEVLKFIAKEMTETCNDAFIARWGGEEFIIIFSSLNGDEAYLRLDALHSKIQRTPIIVCGITINITMTFGLSELPYDNNAEAAIKEADAKLYIGKANGRNQVVY
ncbi:MAG: GGDEF domain-containing protein, partial [Synergistaceae bacterium]|nr:GGDEF domain-containing protein [Synergistaceae bacterium]